MAVRSTALIALAGAFLVYDGWYILIVVVGGLHLANIAVLSVRIRREERRQHG